MRFQVRAIVLTAVSIGLLLAGQGRADEKARDEEGESRAIQGTWRLIAQEDEGKKIPDDENQGLTIFFGGDDYIIRKDDVLLDAGKISFDPSGSPKSLTMIAIAGERKGKSRLGIYELKDGSLRICYDKSGKKLPTEFTTATGSGQVLASYQRERVDDAIEITGTYVTEVADGKGGKQDFEVVIERRGDSYTVTWKVKGQTAYLGTGILTDKVLSVCWLSQGQVGVSSYRVEPGPKLVGRYTMLGGHGLLVSDTLVPKKDDRKSATSDRDRAQRLIGTTDIARGP